MAKILIKTSDISREKWLEYRRTGIGGSDAATVCGLNPSSSLIELWADKTGRLPEKEDNEAMRTGRDLEEYVAKRFCETTGKKVERRNAIFQHGKYDFILANIDRKVVGENAGLECKTTNAFNRSDFESGEIPLYYYVQCMHYMNVMGFDKMYLAVLVGGQRFYWFEIPYDKDEADKLLEAEVEFWNEYIIPDVRPEPDGSDSAGRVLGGLYNKKRDGEITLFPQEKTALKLMEIKGKIKQLKTDEERLKQQLILAMDGNTKGITETCEFSNKTYERASVNSKKLKDLYPEIYKEVCKTSTVQVFNISERKVK
ncbi:MAG: YqaJ viral recombinase family protein [Oscillospiraceae bacterium]|nr:YqaJ viral recombinase family protein [Oscillospiraceae bacterium]